ncbi:hypothetical protein [Asaia sp. As-1742]|uniref:hypothetical protein n=1 Tax=Asaia sp. As-1742 TaxID=2608325 RepID=UPI001420CE85|nr:hypothetical protein [Asaia sp. As-1742]NIE81360.1 hypothetical protein [Asaia sp. As-1742]
MTLSTNPSSLRLVYSLTPGLRNRDHLCTWAQAREHLDAIDELYPGLTVSVCGRTAQNVATLLRGPYPNLHLQKELCGKAAYDLVLTITSSKEMLYDNIATSDTLVSGLGAYRPVIVEVGPGIVEGSMCVVDDPVGAPVKAGDIIQAGKNWSQVGSLADHLTGTPREMVSVFYKSVGCAARDLAACGVAMAGMIELG